MKILPKWFKPAPYIEPIKDSEKIETTFTYWRWRIFYSMFIGYTFYYFTRKSFTFAMPALMVDLGYTKSQLGFLGSIFAVTYGVSKFTSGILADHSNARTFMGFGLIVTGFLNLCFGLSSSIALFALFWGLNGLFQGFGWPPCARLLTHWYSQSERGKWWSLQTVSHNVGGALIPIIAAYAALWFGWRWALFVPGVLCIFCGFFLLNRLRDTPQALGLPTIEEFRSDNLEVKNALDERELTMKEALVDHVLRNPYIWLLAFAYFFVYVARTAFNDWSALYLIEQKAYSTVEASYAIFAFEVGGFLGCLAAGFLSDRMSNGRRGPANILFSVGLLVSAFLLWQIPGGFYLVDFLLLFMIGFFVFGPQMLIGLAAVDMAHKKASATATGFVGLFAYLGAASAGYPLGKIAEDFGWDGFFIASIGCCAIAMLMLLPTWNIETRPKLQPVQA